MKINKIARLSVASWLALSYIGLPVLVFAEVDTTGSSPATSEQLAQPELEKTTAINNNVALETVSGDTLAENNTTAGSLSTGDAKSIATVITSDNAAALPETASFNLAPAPDTFGDLTLALPTQQNSEKPAIIPITTDTGSVANTIVISSLSGGTAANENTTVAQMDSGDAFSNANIINILGSNIAAPEIFLGYITVDGSLTGDILLPANLLQSINSPNTTPSNTWSYGSNINTLSISNSVDSLASSGDALATGNAKISSVESGDGTNMLNSLDLVGANMYGQTGLLVFVNVSGTWDGSILSHEPGTKAALIGVNTMEPDPYLTYFDSSRSTSLANNIKISAISGDVTARSNGSIGDMKSGNATTVVNIANIMGSNLMFTKQFGILFITVLGNWYGSFGFDTPYGNPAASTAPPTTKEAPENKTTASIKSSFITFSYLEKISEQDDLKYENPAMEEPLSYASEFNSIKPNEKTKLKDYMLWGIPFIGGTIALGLMKTKKY